MVVTATLSHATPAAFSSHVKSRYHYDDIALQQSKAGFQVMVGGGSSIYIRSHFREAEEETKCTFLILCEMRCLLCLSSNILKKLRATDSQLFLQRDICP
jgi:alkaline phosphatase